LEITKKTVDSTNTGSYCTEYDTKSQPKAKTFSFVKAAAWTPENKSSNSFVWAGIPARVISVDEASRNRQQIPVRQTA
jgi:hypothetical protein